MRRNGRGVKERELWEWEGNEGERAVEMGGERWEWREGTETENDTERQRESGGKEGGREGGREGRKKGEEGSQSSRPLFSLWKVHERLGSGTAQRITGVPSQAPAAQPDMGIII